MFGKIILMAPDETSTPIVEHLLFFNPALDIIPIRSREALVALPPATLAMSRLLTFTCPIIVPADILAALGYGAYNFHPGPPSYPGLAPASFAIYQRAKLYGATAHAMAEKVDCGPIVGVELCEIAEDASVLDVEMQSFMLLAKIFRRLAHHLATNPEPLPTLPVRWSSDKSSRRSLAAVCDIPLDIEPQELDRRIKAFANNSFNIQPTITLHGRKFRLVEEFAPLDVIPPASLGELANSEALTADDRKPQPPVPAIGADVSGAIPTS